MRPLARLFPARTGSAAIARRIPTPRELPPLDYALDDDTRIALDDTARRREES